MIHPSPKLLAPLLLAATPAVVAAQGASLTPKQVYERCRDSVVSIEVETKDGARSGTGFFYEDGRTVATALHVVRGAKSILIKARGGDSWVPVSIVFDASADTALLRLGANSGRKAIPHAPSNSVSIGDPVYVIGDPLGLTGTLSTGVVGALRQDEGVPIVQITATISQGSSGGPVIDERGRAIGIVSGFLKEGQNLNLAVGTKVAKGLTTNQKGWTLSAFAAIPESGTPATETRADEEAEETVPATEGEKAARTRLAVQLIELYSDLSIAKLKWNAVWNDAEMRSDDANAQFILSAKTMLEVLTRGERNKALLAASIDAGYSQEKARAMSDAFVEIIHAIGDWCTTQHTFYALPEGTSDEAITNAFKPMWAEHLRLADAIEGIPDLLGPVDNALLLKHTAAPVRAAWSLSRFLGIPDWEPSAMAKVRGAFPGSELEENDQVVGIALDTEDAEYTPVADWASFSEYLLENVAKNKKGTRFKLRVRRKGALVIVHESSEDDDRS